MKVYKIRNREGLFSTGGLTPRWKKVGKTWVALQHVNSHINMVRKEYVRYIGRPYCSDIVYPYIDCAVVEYTVQENATYYLRS